MRLDIFAEYIVFYTGWILLHTPADETTINSPGEQKKTRNGIAFVRHLLSPKSLTTLFQLIFLKFTGIYYAIDRGAFNIVF
jgi:hypothetical protein